MKSSETKTSNRSSSSSLDTSAALDTPVTPDASRAPDSQRLFSPESSRLAPEPGLNLLEPDPVSVQPTIDQDDFGQLQQQQQQQEHLQQLEQQQALQHAEKIAYNALSKREYSTQELEEKLLRKKTPVDIVKMVLRQLQAQNLQSDDRFAESFVRSRINKGQGPVRIEMELKQRGISADLAEQHLAAEESFWLAQAKALLARRGLGQEPSDQDEQERQKLIAGHARFLASRGFRTQTITKALPDLFA